MDGSRQLKKLKKAKQKKKLADRGRKTTYGGVMERIIELLQQKVHYLEKFYSLNEQQLEKIPLNQFSNIDEFYSLRENILDVINYISREITEEQNSLDRSPTPQTRLEVKNLLEIKDEYVRRILDQDLRILGQIEEIKTKIIRELQDVKKTKEIFGKYKSPLFHKNLDEKV